MSIHNQASQQSYEAFAERNYDIANANADAIQIAVESAEHDITEYLNSQARTHTDSDLYTEAEMLWSFADESNSDERWAQVNRALNAVMQAKLSDVASMRQAILQMQEVMDLSVNCQARANVAEKILNGKKF